MQTTVSTRTFFAAEAPLSGGQAGGKRPRQQLRRNADSDREREQDRVDDRVADRDVDYEIVALSSIVNLRQQPEKRQGRAGTGSEDGARRAESDPPNCVEEPMATPTTASRSLWTT